jgi:HPt (histidine-containing phosphotransfer) domain-containing protein
MIGGHCRVPITDVLDPQQVWKIVEQDRDLLERLIQIFRDDTSRLVFVMGNAIVAKDQEGLLRATHTLKGSAGIFSPRVAVATLVELEALGLTHDFEGARVVHARLGNEIDRLVDALTDLSAAGAS